MLNSKLYYLSNIVINMCFIIMSIVFMFLLGTTTTNVTYNINSLLYCVLLIICLIRGIDIQLYVEKYNNSMK